MNDFLSLFCPPFSFYYLISRLNLPFIVTYGSEVSAWFPKSVTPQTVILNKHGKNDLVED